MSAKIFKDFNGTKEQFATWLEDPTHAEKVANSVVFIHDPADDNATGGWIYANGVYYACEENTGGVLDEDISINGGPLASQFNEVFSGNKVPEGTSFEEIVRRLILRELWPGATLVKTFTPSLTAPTVTLNPVSGSAVEVGSSVSWTATDTKGTGACSVGATVKATGSGKLSDSSTGSSPYTEKNCDASVVKTETASTQSYSVTVQGTASSGTSGSFTAAFGGASNNNTNKVSVSVTGSKFDYSFSKNVYKVSNTGNVSDSSVVVSGTDTSTLTKGASGYVVGKYYAYVGWASSAVDASDLTSDIITGNTSEGAKKFLELSGKTTIVGEGGVQSTDNSKPRLYIAFPSSTYNLTKCQSTLGTDLIDENSPAYSDIKTVNVKLAGTSTTEPYKVYYFANMLSGGVIVKNIEITKK